MRAEKPTAMRAVCLLLLPLPGPFTPVSLRRSPDGRSLTGPGLGAILHVLEVASALRASIKESRRGQVPGHPSLPVFFIDGSFISIWLVSLWEVTIWRIADRPRKSNRTYFMTSWPANHPIQASFFQPFLKFPWMGDVILRSPAMSHPPMPAISDTKSQKTKFPIDPLFQ